MTVPREWTRAEAEQAGVQALEGYRRESVKRDIPEEVWEHGRPWWLRDADAILDALGLVGTFTVVPGHLEQVGWEMTIHSADTTATRLVREPHDSCNTTAVPVYRIRVVPELETP